MTQENKDLLLKDLCARLPYRVKVSDVVNGKIVDFPYTLTRHLNIEYDKIKPYLRPMSSMTEKEEFEYRNVCANPINRQWDVVDWLNRKMFDYRGLIPIGLALEAPEGMYKGE